MFFFALENRLNFGIVLGPILIDFGLPKAPPCWRPTRRLGVWKLTFFGMSSWCRFGSDFGRFGAPFGGPVNVAV